jgi:hypothetical protein
VQRPPRFELAIEFFPWSTPRSMHRESRSPRRQSPIGRAVTMLPPRMSRSIAVTRTPAGFYRGADAGHPPESARARWPARAP